MPGAITATWTGSYTRDPIVYVPGPPSMLPLSIPIANTAGQWLFAIVSWRQDAGVAGVLQFPSTVNVSDDGNNFWIPVSSGQPQTGVVRTAVWMAPAARVAQRVYISPTSTAAGDAYQAALTALIVEVTACVPWYQVSTVAATYVNQGGSITLSATPPTGLFAIGAIAWDNTSGSVSTTSTGWTGLPSVNATNGTDHTGDLQQDAWYIATAGSTVTLAASGTPTMDWADVIISVHGINDMQTFPYAQPLENWPVLVTEIASGPALNQNPAMLQGAANWSGSSCSVAAVSWPSFQPWPNYQALVNQSLQVTPVGSTVQCNAGSENEPVSTTIRYTAIAYVYSPTGYSGTGGNTGGLYCGINWYTSGLSYITTSGTTSVPIAAGTWTLYTLPAPVFPPPNAAYGSVVITETLAGGGNLPANYIYYVGYAAFGPADAYENLSPDVIAWTDFSSRNFSQGAISISRGIQYEQQSLEAGTMTVNLASNDGAIMFGNILSTYWPNIGDTDVPIRLRAVWPQSLTPYYPMFTGFTDQIEFGWDHGTRYGFAQIEASDAWSRLTSQMLLAAVQEILEDNPGGFWTCDRSGTNIAPAGIVPVTTTTSIFGQGAATSGFGGSIINLIGNQGAACWQSGGITTDTMGVALTYFPPLAAPLPPISSGLSLVFWMDATEPSASQPTGHLTLCTCWSANGPMWTIDIDNTAGGATSYAYITVYDKVTGAGTTTRIGILPFLSTTFDAAPFQFAVTFNQSSLTVVDSASDGVNQESVTVSCNLAATAIGFSWGGNAGPLYANNVGGTPGFMNLAISLAAYFPGILPAARIAAQNQTALNAWFGIIPGTSSLADTDTTRLARIAGYAGATPVVLQMRGWDLGTPPGADLDQVTSVTDTNGQVTSSYFTNIAASTLAFMFVNGSGALVYRRRLEEYDRTIGQWVLGENAALPINSNTLSEGIGTTGWVAANGATISSSSQPQVSPLFESCGLFTGNGSTASPSFQTSPSIPVTEGNWYSFTAMAWSPQGWNGGTGTQGCYWFVTWQTAALATISSITSTLVSIPAGGNAGTFVSFLNQQAPSTAAFAQVFFSMNGTPATSVQMYVANAQITQVPWAPAGGALAAVPEAPYLVDVQLSSDRALLYNTAILTQYGTGSVTTHTGTDLNFDPTSGILVTISNAASVNSRAEVPYTATIYLNNTAQATPYYLNESSIEDFGNWITQTLSSPLLRPDAVTITPAATFQSVLMSVGAEVGDTVTFRRRPLGAPEIQIVTYISKLSHNIDIAAGQWQTKYELSPFPQGNILACDDVIHGTLTGGNYYGW